MPKDLPQGIYREIDSTKKRKQQFKVINPTKRFYTVEEAQAELDRRNTEVYTGVSDVDRRQKTGFWYKLRDLFNERRQS